MLPYHAVNHATDGTDPCDPPRKGAKSTTTSNHPNTPLLKCENNKLNVFYYVLSFLSSLSHFLFFVLFFFLFYHLLFYFILFYYCLPDVSYNMT